MLQPIMTDRESASKVQDSFPLRRIAITRPTPIMPAKKKPTIPNTGRGIPQADVPPAVVITNEILAATRVAKVK